MTRTQKLSLFTWQLSDPVDLSQMNENFHLLDQNGCRTEAALWNSAIGLLAAEHAGCPTSHAEAAYADCLRSPARCTAYENVCFGASGAELLTQGAANRSFTADYQELTPEDALLVSSYTPEGYGTLTGITVSGSQNGGSGLSVTLTLCCGNETVAQAEQTLSATTQGFSMQFSFSCLLDPNKTYSLYIRCPDIYYHSVQVTNILFTPSALTYVSGSFQTAAFSVPSGASRIRLMCSTDGFTPGVQLASNGGWVSLSPVGGAEAGLFTAQASLPAGLQTVSLKFSLSGAGSHIRDFAYILF